MNFLPLYTTVPRDLISVKLATADALLKTFPRLKNLVSVRVTIVTGIDTVLSFPVNLRQDLQIRTHAVMEQA